jgi:hypothetical protein
MELFDNLPDGMTAQIDHESKTIYIHDVPHTLIDCLDGLVSGWRDVIYANPDAVFEKARTSPDAKEHLMQPLFAIFAVAEMNGFETVAFHPVTIPAGVAVYRDAEGNIRPSLGFDPVNVSAINRPAVGISLGTDEEGHTQVMMTGSFTVNAPKLTIYIQSDNDDQT